MHKNGNLYLMSFGQPIALVMNSKSLWACVPGRRTRRPTTWGSRPAHAMDGSAPAFMYWCT